ncbi:hypothetical protein BET03_11840 [Thermohalobacter berrensis]|uniref:Uncharacterized protein n=1 Tax=Thermohalobacter berrensis TaxID=99594 RepID=A0A419T353_9FIRM|nr:hypothetical protein BET03_11840 [Thermohalobacter berrensis]
MERALWSIAIPGFGQLLNGKYIKGLVLITLEFFVNVNANLNTVIISSFYGNTLKAIREADYQWLMFYPCLYMFAIWDTYTDGSDIKEELSSSVPFALGAYFGTIGVIYSKTFSIGGILLGPIWLSIICIFIGLIIGYIAKLLYFK